MYSRPFNPEDIVVAMSIIKLSSWIFTDAIDYDHPELISKFPSPEKTLIKREKYQSLSDEAKVVIDLALNEPSLVHGAYGRSTVTAISRHMQKKLGYKRRKVQRAIHEVRAFVGSF